MILITSVPDLGPPGAFAQLGQRLQYEMIADLADMARAHWVKLAGEQLTQTRRDYIAGIQQVIMRQGVASIVLLGVVPNLVEHGQDAYDMHDTLLGGNVPIAPVGERGKHPKKDGGFYRAIPFRHATPGTTGAVGAQMGSAYAKHPAFAAGGGGFMQANAQHVTSAAALGQGVYAAAKKLQASVGQPGGKVRYGGRLPGGMAPKLQDRHHSDIYAGMVKSQKTYAQATQSQYTTFRTISTGSPGWLRPATPGRHLAAEVQSFVARQAPATIEMYLKRMQTP